MKSFTVHWLGHPPAQLQARDRAHALLSAAELFPGRGLPHRVAMEGKW